MLFKDTLSIVESSAIFKKFIKENPYAELCAGFFILELLNNQNQKSLDYRLNDKIFTFELDKNDEVIMRQDKLIQDSSLPKLQKISSDIKVDLNEIPSITEKIALQNNIKNRFQKIIAILQVYQNQQVWNLTCILDGLIILNILIDSDSGGIIKFRKRGMADFIRKG